jgi:hypothetical protein
MSIPHSMSMVLIEELLVLVECNEDETELGLTGD